MPETTDYRPQYVKTGFAGYGPDLDPEDMPCETVRDVCESIRFELDSLADGLEQTAEVSADSEDFETAWKSHKLAQELETLRANLDYDQRAKAPLYRDDLAALDASMLRIISERFPLDVQLEGSLRLYVWDAADEA